MAARSLVWSPCSSTNRDVCTILSLARYGSYHTQGTHLYHSQGIARVLNAVRLARELLGRSFGVTFFVFYNHVNPVSDHKRGHADLPQAYLRPLPFHGPGSQGMLYHVPLTGATHGRKTSAPVEYLDLATANVWPSSV